MVQGGPSRRKRHQYQYQYHSAYTSNHSLHNPSQNHGSSEIKWGSDLRISSGKEKAVSMFSKRLASPLGSDSDVGLPLSRNIRY